MSSDLAGSTASPPPLPPGPPLPPPLPRSAKSPGLALVLSIVFPGLGQVYNGQPAKALAFLFGVVGSIYGAVEINPLPFAFLIPFAYFWGLVDAYRSAELINARAAGGALPPEEDMVESPAWGGALALLGLLLLANNLGWLRLAALQRWWPLVLVVVGGLLFYNSFQRRKGPGDTERL